MDIWLILHYVFQYNVLILAVSALGFLVSLVWYTFSERQRRVRALLKDQVQDEGNFFGQFDDIENPSLKVPDFSFKTGPLHAEKKNEFSEAKGKSSSETSTNTSVQLNPKADVEVNPSETSDEKTLASLMDQIQAKSKNLGSASQQKGPTSQERTQSKETKAQERPAFPVQSRPQSSESLNQKESHQKSDFQKVEPNMQTQEVKAKEKAPHEAQEIFEYDDDEKKVKDLLEQIKKDMHEQGGQNP